MLFSEKTDVPQLWIFSFSTAVTLKIRSRSQNLIISLLCPNYVAMKIWKESHYWCKQEIITPTPMELAPKSICPPTHL